MVGGISGDFWTFQDVFQYFANAVTDGPASSHISILVEKEATSIMADKSFALLSYCFPNKCSTP